MKPFFLFYLTGACLIFISSCGVAPRDLTVLPVKETPKPEVKKESPPKVVESKPTTPKPAPATVSVPAATPSSSAVERELTFAFNDWNGVKYKAGGAGFDGGIDGPNLVRIVYEDHFDVQLPADFGTLKRSGKSVSKEQVKAGDLVFFSGNPPQVGIVLNSTEFMIVDSGSGVQKRLLADARWTGSFTEARRVL